MSQLALPAAAPRALSLAPVVFAGAVLMSAALVFLVQPMLGKLTLPLLGGSPAVWNTSMAFFQAALLVGYAYAHLLQRLVASLKLQAGIHVLVLAAAASVLPLELNGILRDPPAEGSPIPWLLGVLALTIGAPFAALSATAPLMQAWYARLRLGRTQGENPYVLYAASNLGSLLALVGYPLVLEPLLTLAVQRGAWTGGYALFVLIAGVLALIAARAPTAPAQQKAAEGAAPVSWRDRAIWVLLAAAPSSLMMGVTSHLATDVASAPFLWVAPLALYLITFIVAFQSRPLISVDRAGLWQAAAVLACAFLLPLRTGSWPLQLGVHLGAFFLTALVCHHALAARRPAPARLTEFYLLMSLGGVIGGSFNAFVAPTAFTQVWEYPLVLALAALARPWGRGRWSGTTLAVVGVGLAGAAAGVAFGGVMAAAALAGLGLCFGVAFIVRDRAPAFTLLLAAGLLGGEVASGALKSEDIRRSFFGVHRVALTEVKGIGPVRLLFNGTTIHGGQAVDETRRCTPIAYYVKAAPIPQTLHNLAVAKPNAKVAVVGLGAGAVAAFSRPGDLYRFFEIDPAVVEVARDSGAFSFLTTCAKGTVDYRLGDARLTLGREAPGAFDLILLDAFASDSVPTHLLTVQAMRGYLNQLAPDGALVVHLTNRNLDLMAPAAAVAREAGLVSAQQVFVPTPDMGPAPGVAGSAVMVMARDHASLRRIAANSRWTTTDPAGVRAWTDDYTNILGALVSKLMK